MITLQPEHLIAQVQDAHEQTLRLIDGLSAQQLMGPRLSGVNPLRWETAHVAYFYELWVLRHHLKNPPLIANADNLYNSATIAHDDRWDLPLLTMEDTHHYIQTVHKRVINSLSEGQDSIRDYLTQYAIFHQDMHNEAYTYTRQTLNYPAPCIKQPKNNTDLTRDTYDGDVNIPAGVFMLGATAEDGFVFDNEKWAHPVNIAAFSIAKTAVSNANYLSFVKAEGYKQQQYWDNEGWQWLQESKLQHPIYWRQINNKWQIKQFDQWKTMPLNAALIHVCWHEAQAYCRWAQRRLPTEAEWEVAAAASSNGTTLNTTKHYYPWGDNTPEIQHANLDGLTLGTINVNARSAGDSELGCRQMIGNVWEWTQSTFEPYPGFKADMYEDYSQPLFGKTKVLRGGSWATRSRIIRNTWRNYYGPERNDVFAGFRTCAL